LAIQPRERVPAAPFVAMAATVSCFFLYAASALLAPWWVVALLLVAWAVLFALNCAWFVRHPRRTLALPLVAVALWSAVVAALALNRA
jgi:hypothetical protein